MMPENGLRHPVVIREELEDLLTYLDGLPAEVRQSGAFAGYEQRAGELGRELVVSDMLLFTRQLPRELSGGLTATSAVDYKRMHDTLSELAQRYQRAAEHSLFTSRAIHWAVLAASAGSLLTAVSATTALVVPFSGVAASLAAFYVLRVAKRVREHQLIAQYFANLREEIADSFGPSGEILRPSEYYRASTRRIERLLDDIRAHVAPGTGPGSSARAGGA